MSLLVCALHWCAFVWATLCCAPASPESAGYSHSDGGHFRECRARVGNSHHGCHLELQCNPCSYCRARQSIGNRDSSAVIFVFRLRQALSAESRPDLRLKACLLCNYACPALARSGTAHGAQSCFETVCFCIRTFCIRVSSAAAHVHGTELRGVWGEVLKVLL